MHQWLTHIGHESVTCRHSYHLYVWMRSTKSLPQLYHLRITHVSLVLHIMTSSRLPSQLHSVISSLIFLILFSIVNVRECVAPFYRLDSLRLAYLPFSLPSHLSFFLILFSIVNVRECVASFHRLWIRVAIDRTEEVMALSLHENE